MEKLNLSAPWEIFYREMDEMFGADPEIDIKIDREAQEVTLYVDNSVKADALQKLLPETKIFGDIEVKLTVVPSNDEDDPVSLYERAFFGNPVFEYAVKSCSDSFEANYIVFENKVVQFFCDNLSDIFGNRSTLYEELARDIFDDHAGIFFCTDSLDDPEELPFF